MIIVSGGSEASASARSAVLDYLDRRQERGLSQMLDTETFVREFTRPLLRPFHWVASRSARKIREGDFNAGARPLLVLAQLQGFLLLLLIVLFLTALVTIIESLPYK